MFSISLLAITLFQEVPLSDHVSLEVLSRYGFSNINEVSPAHLTLSRTSDGGLLSIRVVDDLNSGRILEERYDKPTSARMRRNWTPSGFPVGQYNRISPTGSEISAVSYAGGMRETVQCSIWLNANQVGTEPLKFIPVEQEQVKLEAFTRDVLGGYAARRLAPDGNVLLGGASYTVSKASGTNARLIELDTWLSRNNLTSTASHDGTVLNFTKGGTPWIVPLGSVKIKKGEDWITMPDLVMRRSGKYFIPVSGLN